MRRLSILGAASLLLGFTIATAARAETFTFSGTGQTADQVFVTMDGRTSGAVYSTSTSTTTMASGKALATKGQCMQWTAEPGGMMTGNGVCTAEDSTGKFSLGFSCQEDMKNNTADCWGKLTGTSGAYANKQGTLSWRSKGNAERKSITFSGAGMWD